MIHCILFVASFIAPTIGLAGEPPTTQLPQMLKKILPAIVNISVESIDYADPDTLLEGGRATPSPPDKKISIKSFSVGSGVIFNAKKGLIVTNAHVIKDAKVVVVTLKNGDRMHAKIIASAPAYDIAILKIHSDHLLALPFADSNTLEVGQSVTAIGSPYGLSQTVTTGIVSALHRSHPHIEGYQSFIQTDAPINPGNSGGALVNTNGKLVGINTAIVAPTPGSIGLGFAIPSNMVNRVIHQLLAFGHIRHGMLGVMVENLTPSLANALHVPVKNGALVTQVLPGSPAALTQLKPEDVVTSINHHKIFSAEQLKNIMALTPPDTKVHLAYFRNNKQHHIQVKLANPHHFTLPNIKYFAGMELQALNELGPDGKTQRGILVTRVRDSSPGALAGLRAGDLITSINGQKMQRMRLVANMIKTHSTPLLLSVLRGGHPIYMLLQRS